MSLTVRIDDQVSSRLEKLRRDMPKVIDQVMKEVAGAYMAHVRRKYISGQVLRRVTSELYRAYKVKKRRDQIYEVYPGTLNYVKLFETGGIIRPKKKSVLRFFIGGEMKFAPEVYIRRRPFIGPSVRDFIARDMGAKKAGQVVDREITKRGLA